MDNLNNIEMSNINYSAPWVVYASKLKVLFDDDPEIRVVYDEDAIEVKLYIENHDKADAIKKLLPYKMTFGNVTLKITIIPMNFIDNKCDLFNKAFVGNPIFAYLATVRDLTNPITYVVFKKKVVQYYADNLHDPHGYCSTLYQDIAADVFGEDKGIFFATDSSDK